MWGRRPGEAYVRLDLEDAPWNYLTAEPFFEDGQVVVEVSNGSGYRLADIVVRVHVEINGASIYRRLSLSDLTSGYHDVLESGIRYRDADDVEAETRVLSAAPGWYRGLRADCGAARGDFRDLWTYPALVDSLLLGREPRELSEIVRFRTGRRRPVRAARF